MRGAGIEERAAWKAYEHGDAAEALPLFLSLAHGRQPYYLVVAARMDGRGTAKDYGKARELLGRAMSVGVQEAFLQRAALANVEGDRDTYIRLLIEAERQGQTAARYYLGKCYLEGQDLSMVAKGIALIRRACDEEHLGAQILMARVLLPNPKDFFGFLSGARLFVLASAKHLYLAFKNPHDERIR